MADTTGYGYNINMTKVRCELCPTECELGEYEIGGCRVRINRGGELWSLVYAKPCAVHVDPIEKKPFFHFLPGSKAFSIATVGCVLGCKFCQNWQISQVRPEEADFTKLPPGDVVLQTQRNGCRSVTYTYTEPTVFYEYMYDTAIIARRSGVRNTMHTCGYINPRPLAELAPLMDAADVDLKAFTEDFYARICGGRLRPVLDTIVALKRAGVWVELTNLLIPTLNDNPSEIRDMCRWVVQNAGAEVPIHFSRFFPDYKLKDLPPTPPGTLDMARSIALDAGLRHVYLGNIRSEAEHTFCHQCKRLIIRREGYAVLEIAMKGARCAYCGALIAGVWT